MEIDDKEQIARLNKLGIEAFNAGKYDSALNFFQKLFQISEKEGDEKKQHITLSQIIEMLKDFSFEKLYDLYNFFWDKLREKCITSDLMLFQEIVREITLREG